MAKPLTIYLCRDMGAPVQLPRERFGETVPNHADMLRYDLAFHSPTDPSHVIFPKFKGGYGGKITNDRWRSFCLTLTRTELEVQGYGDWITYTNELKPETFDEVNARFERK